MTWAKFKEWVESSGVRDDERIWFIDVSPSAMAQRIGCVMVCRDENNGVYITQSKGVPPK